MYRLTALIYIYIYVIYIYTSSKYADSYFEISKLHYWWLLIQTDEGDKICTFTAVDSILNTYY